MGAALDTVSDMFYGNSKSSHSFSIGMGLFGTALSGIFSMAGYGIGSVIGEL